jgi:hypothetical protein
VYQGIQAAEGLLDSFHEYPYLIAFGQVHWMRRHVSSLLLQSLRDGCCVPGIEVGNDDLCASSGKVLDNSSPDALAASGDENDLAGKVVYPSC